MNDKQQPRFTVHLFRAGVYVGTFFWLALVYTGLVLVSRKHSDLIGWTILVVAAAVMIASMNRWAKYLQVILGGGILGGLLATIQGHLLNGNPFPRWSAAGITGLLIGCSLIAQTLVKRNLKAFDRIALVAFLLAFLIGMVEETPTAALIGLTVGFVCLVLAWAYDRFTRRRRSDHSSSNPDHVMV